MAVIQITSSPSGKGNVSIDARDVSKHLTGIDVRIRAGELTSATLYYTALDIEAVYGIEKDQIKFVVGPQEEVGRSEPDNKGTADE